MELVEHEFVMMSNDIHGLIHISNPVGARRRRSPRQRDSFVSPAQGLSRQSLDPINLK